MCESRIKKPALKLQLLVLAGAAWRIMAPWAEGSWLCCLQPVPFTQPTDDAGLASGLVLREMHSALMRGIEGRGGLGSIGAEAPRTAKLALSETQAGVDWTRRVSKVILDSPPFAVDDEARVIRSRTLFPAEGSTASLELCFVAGLISRTAQLLTTWALALPL